MTNPNLSELHALVESVKNCEKILVKFCDSAGGKVADRIRASVHDSGDTVVGAVVFATTLGLMFAKAFDKIEDKALKDLARAVADEIKRRNATGGPFGKPPSQN